MDAGLKRELEAKIYAGERLTREDGTALFGSDDLAWLGRLAHHKRTEINGDRAWFAVNRRLNLDEAVSRATELAGRQITELHIVNAVHSDLPWSYYPDALRQLRAALPGVSLVGFTTGDVQRLAAIAGRPAGEILGELTDAGLESLSGDADETVHRLAHERGMKTSAAMVFDGIDHVIRLRELQDETGGFVAFLPLPRESAAPAEALKAFAVSRLLFDNVDHVRSSWAVHGLPVAQLSLNFGADDLDGSIADFDETRDLLNLIWDAGLRPVERTTRYEVVREHDAAPRLADRRSEPQQVWA